MSSRRSSRTGNQKVQDGAKSVPITPSPHVERFSGRALAYSRYRPGYPVGILEILRREVGFNDRFVVADIGSGTGLLSRLFVSNGNKVIGVEPNDDMSAYARRSFSRMSNFASVKATAEDTSLPSHSIDLIAVGQALHWFDPVRAKREFERILKKDAYVAVVFNERRTEQEAGLLRDYADLIARHGRDRAAVPEIDEAYLRKFFRRGSYRSFVLPNEQRLDLRGLIGRLASASYMPHEGDPGFSAMVDDATRVFDARARKGRVTLLYDTVVWLGRV